MERDADQGNRFGTVAALYDDIRPGYPVEAVAYGTNDAEAPLDVADIGAGTGKLTAVIASLGHRVVAVEPDARMLETLGEVVPFARRVCAPGEATTLEPASVDALFVAQAFHWMDPQAAFAEFARVTRPGGFVTLVWNVRDERVGWVARFNSLLSRFGDGAMANHPAKPSALDWPGFEQGVQQDFRYEQELDVERLVTLVASRSYVIALTPTARAAFFDEVRNFARTDPELRDQATFVQPYVTRCFRFQRTA